MMRISGRNNKSIIGSGLAIRDALHLAILSAMRSFPLQVRNSNSDGACESQNCFDELLTCSSCFEMVNKQARQRD